jgi:hypothetical protein
MVGYQYEGCSFIYWETTVVKLAGYDLGSSEIGNWNIDIHHRLNTQQGNSKGFFLKFLSLYDF